MLTIFLAAFLVGLLFNATPGPVFAESLRRGLKGGFEPAFAVQIGSLVGDAVWAVIGLAGVGALFRIDWLSEPLSIAGALYLFYLGAQGLRDAARLAGEARRRGPAISSQRPSVKGDTTALPPIRAGRGAFAAGAVMSVTNPQNLAFWAALASVMPALGVDEPDAVHYATFFAGFMTSAVIWSFVCAGLIAWIRHKLPAGVQASLALICGATLIVLAILQLVRIVEERGQQHAHRPQPVGLLAASNVDPSISQAE